MQTTKPSIKAFILPALLLLSLFTSAQTTQKISVAGIVTDSAGNLLTGVSISEGNTIIAVTGDKGAFNFTINKGSRLVFSFVGFQNFIYAASHNSNTVRITLATGATTLDDVVVTTALGYYKAGENAWLCYHYHTG
jgi:hypothetical protein